MYLFGASGHGKVIKEIIEANGQQVDAFVDDNLNVNELCGIKVLHGETSLSPMIVSVGANHIRKIIVENYIVNMVLLFIQPQLFPHPLRLVMVQLLWQVL